MMRTTLPGIHQPGRRKKWFEKITKAEAILIPEQKAEYSNTNFVLLSFI
jgi:hypothetical protein